MGQVRRRRVFYIPGYDPVHPRRYRELYRKEGAEQAAISGYDITLKARLGKFKRYGWQVEAEIDGQHTESEVEVLFWSDIVKDSMERGIFGTYLQLVRTAWAYISTGALFRLMRLRQGPVIAALYPVGFLLLQLLMGIVLGCVVGAAVAWGVSLLTGWHWVLGLLKLGIAAAITVWVVRWFRDNDNRFFAYYLMHDYSYSASSNGANPPELETRIAEFVEVLADALSADVDEVLVVGHSSGAHLGVSILSDLIRSGRVTEAGPKLGFLSLGQVVPMVSFLPDAWRLRADLAYLTTRQELTWIDITAPSDGGCFALCDPVYVSGVAPADKHWPLVVSAAYTQTLSPETYKSMRWKFFRKHFQYLCAFDRPGDYDYFQITAGPKTLQDRYRDRQPSKSRIEKAASKFTSQTPS